MLVFDEILLYIREGISLIGVAIIVVGAVRSLHQLLKMAWGKKVSTGYIRWQLGESIILGLEFMVGADIIGSLVKPDYYNLGMLAIVVLVRTILSYFLNQELASLTHHQQEQLR